MKVCFCYFLFEPLRSIYTFTDKLEPTFSVPVRTAERECELALFSEGNVPIYARVGMPGLVQEALSDQLMDMIQAVKEHLISMLRLTYSSETRVFPSNLWHYVEEGQPYDLGFAFSSIFSSRVFDPQKTRRLFVATFNHREDIRLLIDGLDPEIPLQYRYLSLYKILEQQFRTPTGLDESRLDLFLQPYEPIFRQAGIMQKPRNYVIQLRDSCAHISKRSGTSMEMGVTHLNRNKALAVEKILPILAKVCADRLNYQATGDYSIDLTEYLKRPDFKVQENSEAKES